MNESFLEAARVFDQAAATLRVLAGQECHTREEVAHVCDAVLGVSDVVVHAVEIHLSRYAVAAVPPEPPEPRGFWGGLRAAWLGGKKGH